MSFFKQSEFEKLSSACKAAIISAAVHHRFDDEQVIFLQNENGKKLFFVGKGFVKIGRFTDDGRFTAMVYISEGDAFGELGWYGDGEYPDSAIAVGNTHVWSLTFAQYSRLSQQYDEFGHAVTALMKRRYNKYQDVISELSRQSLTVRLACTLLRLSKELQQKVEFNSRNFPVVSSIINQSELGNIARGSRGNINRILKIWERDGIIKAKDRSIILLKPGQLENIAASDGLED